MKFTWVDDESKRFHWVYTNYRANEAKVWATEDKRWSIVSHPLTSIDGTTTIFVRKDRVMVDQIPCTPLCVAFVVKELMDMAEVSPGNAGFAKQVRSFFTELQPVADECALSAYMEKQRSMV